MHPAGHNRTHTLELSHPVLAELCAQLITWLDRFKDATQQRTHNAKRGTHI